MSVRPNRLASYSDGTCGMRREFAAAGKFGLTSRRVAFKSRAANCRFIVSDPR